MNIITNEGFRAYAEKRMPRSKCSRNCLRAFWVGTAAKMFLIVGPVIVHGKAARVIYGIILLITK